MVFNQRWANSVLGPNMNMNTIWAQKFGRIRTRILFGFRDLAEYEYHSVCHFCTNTNTNTHIIRIIPNTSTNNTEYEYINHWKEIITKTAYWVFCSSKWNRQFEILTSDEIYTIWFPKYNRIRIQIIFGFEKSCEYECIRFSNIIQIRIRIVFILKKSAEYEYHYSVSTIWILFEYWIIRSPLGLTSSRMVQKWSSGPNVPAWAPEGREGRSQEARRASS